MSRAFDARIRVLIGPPGRPGRAIEGLRIAFTVEKDDAPDVANRAEVKIYNLAKGSRDATREPNALIQVFAGYRDALNLVFLGAITRSVTDDDGTDIITTVTSERDTVGKGTLSTTLKGQQKLKDVLKAATAPLEAAGIDLSAVEDGVVNAPRGVVLSGPPGQVLNKLTRANNLDWFVEDGVVRVVPRGVSTQERAFVISPTSGLVGSPRPLKPSTDEGAGRRLGIEFSARLNGAFRLRRVVQIAGTEELAGWYQLRKIKHEADLWAQKWDSVCEATPVRGVARG